MDRHNGPSQQPRRRHMRPDMCPVSGPAEIPHHLRRQGREAGLGRTQDLTAVEDVRVVIQYPPQAGTELLPELRPDIEFADRRVERKVTPHFNRHA